MTFTPELDKTLARLDAEGFGGWADHVRDVANRYPDMRMVGLVVRDDGSPDDVCFNWESCESYALNEGMRVLALQGDGPFTRPDLQRMLDRTRREYMDCFYG